MLQPLKQGSAEGDWVSGHGGSRSRAGLLASIASLDMSQLDLKVNSAIRREDIVSVIVAFQNDITRFFKRRFDDAEYFLVERIFVHCCSSDQV